MGRYASGSPSNTFSARSRRDLGLRVVHLACREHDRGEHGLAYRIPLIDLGVGIVADEGEVEEAGARVAVVTPGGPCLHCMGEIDQAEAAHNGRQSGLGKGKTRPRQA